ncbi:exonuclease domain-containing protein [Psychrobacter sp. FDAARGOS_221]|uniref:exonuclease domain-containing protein n=1 Tax=Psychrobacter sp. FDAARGOS_221 TaxID=1975705 RepID=UPI000BB55152|nr:exonuclease domain-containing protein [Psychrobacter sp. FDAARGOS_221]PNK59777.1 DNA polymerase III subunit epsilon [Psychrobacter sp. FDAARGOS_221]
MTTYILDTETTGLNEPHMTEAAYSIVDIDAEGKVIVIQAPRSKRFNPLKPISLGAMATSHICDEDVVNETPHTDFRLPSKVQYLIGHNIDFDMQVLKNAGVTHTPKLICTKAMSNYLLPTLDSHTLVALLYYFHPTIAREQAKEAHAAEYDIYFTQLVLGSLIELAKSQGHVITDMASLYQFSELARIPTHFSFGKYKGQAITDVAATADGAGYLQWLLNQDTIDPYLAQACKQALG